MRHTSPFPNVFRIGIATVAVLFSFVAVERAAAVPGAVPESMARAAARGWLSRRIPAGRAVPAVSAMRKVTALARDASGNESPVTLAWVADVEGGGSVILSANDAHAPVIAFSPNRRIGSVDPRSPLATLLARDAEQRQSATAAAAWARLASVPDMAAATGRRDFDSLIDDIRVPPFLVTKWDQGEVTYTNVVEVEGEGEKVNVVTRKVFNKDTPNNYLCGCVATAMAQAMYFFRWPLDPIEAFSEMVMTDAANATWSPQRFPADPEVGEWTFDWSQMAEDPSEAYSAMGGGENGDAAVAANAAQLAALAYACGVSVHTAYSADGSGSFVPLVAPALTERFGYAGAKAYQIDYGLSPEILARIIHSNLDYGHPVILGIAGAYATGHAVLCDGYGYVSDAAGGDPTPYYHLNMGWSGQDDVWYALPKIDASEADFNVIRRIVYNIFPEDEDGRPAQEDGIVSGRVVNQDGDPFPGVGVTLTRTRTLVVTNVVDNVETVETSTSTETYGPVETNERGIYAMRLPAGQPGDECVAKAEFGLSRGEGDAFAPLAESTVVNYVSGAIQDPGVVGNLWGVDFSLDAEGRGGADTVGEAVNNTKLTFAAEGDASWFGEVTDSYDGKHAARSGEIADSGVSTVRTAFSAGEESTLSFVWKVSSEAAADHVRFFLNGAETNRISGTTEWRIVEMPLPSGPVELAWQYAKDESLSKGEDAAWVDAVRVSGGDRSDFQVWMVDTYAVATDEDYLVKGAEDADGDGISNLLEYIAGTNPTDASDKLRITSIVKGDGTAELQWAPDGLSGRVYTVEATDSLSPAAWTPVESGVSSPWTDSEADGEARFYQVKVEMSVPDYEE